MSAAAIKFSISFCECYECLRIHGASIFLRGVLSESVSMLSLSDSGPATAASPPQLSPCRLPHRPSRMSSVHALACYRPHMHAQDRPRGSTWLICPAPALALPRTLRVIALHTRQQHRARRTGLGRQPTRAHVRPAIRYHLTLTPHRRRASRTRAHVLPYSARPASDSSARARARTGPPARPARTP